MLPSFSGRTSVYRSMLRVAVKKIDTVKPPRSFGDKDEWKAVLKALQEAGKLTYSEQNDTILLCTDAAAVAAEALAKTAAEAAAKAASAAATAAATAATPMVASTAAAAAAAVQMAAQAEAVPAVQAEMRKHLTCAICMDLFIEPLSLPCHHTFCKQCIYKHFALGSQTCPTCRAPAWRRQATSNHLLANMVATLQGEPGEPAQKKRQRQR